MNVTTPANDLMDMRARVGSALNRLSAELVSHTPVDTGTASEARARVAWLGQIAAGLAIVEADALPSEGAGFGSVVTVENVETGAIEEYTLMVGALVDIDANHVSMASPIGQALLGRKPGDEFTIRTPHRRVKLRIIGLVTLTDLLELDALRIGTN